MEDIWMNACKNLEISDDIARPWYERIRKKMVQGSGRFYHNWDELLLRKEDYLRERNCVEKNCEAFDEFCSDAGLKDAPMAKIVRKLLGDESIEPIPETEGDAYLLQDLDLLVLGSPREEYKRYRELLRKEYSHLDDDSYKQMRLKVTDPRPSTSREAGNTSTSPIKFIRQTRPFVKFKDDKYKNRTKKCITQANRKHIHYGCSPSQIVTKKILRTIRKKINLSPNKQIRTKNRLSVCDLTEKEVAKDVPESKVTGGHDDDDDDDCVLIDPSPEIILIDDESVVNCDRVNLENASNGLNISNISSSVNTANLLFKPYQPIGSVANYQKIENNFLTALHSTPKLVLNENTRYPIAPHCKRTMPMILETTSNGLDVGNTNVRTNEAVVIEDTIGETTRTRKRKSQEADDSVIFVSEVLNKPPVITADYIPLITPTEKYPISTPKQEPRSKRQRNELFNLKEQKQLRQYNENAYNPNKDTPTTMTKKRMVIVDGSNVAYHHALNKEFSVKGLKICLEYFEKLGHEVKAVVPQFRLQKLRSTDPTALEKLNEEGKIVFTPCKNLPGKSSSSYDDRFILQLAAELDAAIVSNDNYRDLIHENPAFKKIIENRVVGFSWCNDLFILPKDPYGKWGPALSSILNRS